MNEKKHVPRSTRIFENKNAGITLFKVMLPQILTSFISGLYILISQIFLNTWVSTDGVHGNAGIWGQNYENIQGIGKPANGEIKTIPPMPNAEDIVHSSVAISLPLIIIVTALSLGISMGLSILFGSAVGKKNTSEANRIGTSGMFPTFLFCVIITIALGFSLIPLLHHSSGYDHKEDISFLNGKMNPNIISKYQNDLRDFYKIYYQKIVSYSFSYVLPILLTLFVQTFVMGTWFCLASEGKQIIMVIVSLSCNLLNILFDFCFIRFAKLGMLSGGLGIALTFIVNALILISYLFILNKRGSTLITLNMFKLKIEGVLFLSILIAGISSLLRSFSSALSIFFFQLLLVKVTSRTGQEATRGLKFGGSVMPIQNLLFSTALGIVRATRILFSYHLAAGNINYVRKIFFIGILYSIILSSSLFLIIANKQVGLTLLHQFFGLPNDNKTNSDALKYMQIIFTTIIMYGFMMVGMTFFQVAGRILNASLAAIFSGIGFSIIVLPIMYAIAISKNNELIYIYGGMVSGIVAGIFIFTYSSIYLVYGLKPGYVIHHPAEQFNRGFKKHSLLKKI